LAVFTAVTSFVLLTGNVSTQRLEVTGAVEGNFRGAYDILVRPKGSTTALEASNAQVRSSFLSGTYGGISLA
jgi:putative ABC transport system permease protein